MNIVFDFGNVLVEWNPVRLIDLHYPADKRPRYAAADLAPALIEHRDWQDFDRGALGGDELATRSARRLGLDRESLAAFVDGIPHVLPILHDSVAAVVALTGNAANGAAAAAPHRIDVHHHISPPPWVTRRIWCKSP